VVRVEVNSQIEAAKEEMSQDFGPFKDDLEFGLMEPLNELRFEFDDLRNQVQGTDYVSGSIWKASGWTWRRWGPISTVWNLNTRGERTWMNSDSRSTT
jgi:hypothetical protein